MNVISKIMKRIMSALRNGVIRLIPPQDIQSSEIQASCSSESNIISADHKPSEILKFITEVEHRQTEHDITEAKRVAKQSIPKRVIHLARYGRTERIRKKNRHRLNHFIEKQTENST